MFQTLIASGPQARPAAHRYLLSLSVHGAALAGAIVLTRYPSALTPSRRPEPAIVFFAPHPGRQVDPATSRRMPGQATPAPPAWQADVSAPDLSRPTLSASGPTIADLLDGFRLDSRAASGCAGSGLLGVPSTSDLRTAASVDDPVALMEQPQLRYPPALAQAGIAGRVELEYVVDTVGRAEPGSLRTLVSTHPAFETAARTAVLGTRYQPARLRGQLVRQLVRQTLSFRLER